MKNHALLVGIGIFFSRIAGLVRERVFAHYFGNSDAGDAFKAALKIPNFLQNLFGEGVLSASFIPVYAQLLAKKHDEEAAKVASVIGSLLFLMTSLLVISGVFATPFLIDLIAPGFVGAKRELTIKIVQVLFPGTGFLVMSAWCLGILNSHKKFFLSYVAPVIWNLTIIATLVIWGAKQPEQFDLAVTVSWGLVAGSFLQFFVQLPSALRLGKKVYPSLDLNLTSVRTIIRNFVPVVVSRGVVQVSAYIDNMLASLLPTGAVSSLAYAQTLYLLPVSLFGMSVSAAELPTMSQATGSEEEIREYLKQRLNRGLEQIAFFIIPSVVAFLFLGDLIVGAVFQTGQFDANSTKAVWFVLIGSTVGLLASTLGRLYSSTFYSLKDTRTPLQFAIIRVIFTTFLGGVFGFYLPKALGLEASWGTPGLTASAGLAGWIEFYFLRKALNKKIGKTGLSLKYQAKVWSIAIVSAGIPALLAHFVLTTPMHVIVKASIAVVIYGLLYFTLGYLLKVEQAHSFLQKILRRLR
ncbi:murein biosynthesis integral membrane protein MurJ [Bdellovibrio svalbardensis]|uniref:Probable lipid II flippase MurJ n=1 Tax=Bdellovibrio svalbardensis TaxID=2972972 RepID=A0ABT6DM65_9BACT|nr:murein biosynthesis integral membrane protein MurJ [Bdellovibrio svalbardensis]MDG0816228.1 murein biosynthesis integral membrane protein MurJ [Bdellovibrio svalbardensis]